MELARMAAPLDPEEAQEALEGYVAGMVLAHWEDERATARRDRSLAEAASVEAERSAAVQAERAEGLEAEADQADQRAQVHSQDEIAARATIDARLAEFETKFPLLVRAVFRFGWVAVPATAAGLGALVYLALEGTDPEWVRWLLVGAAVAGGLATEMLLGALGAEIYDDTERDRRRRLVVRAFVALLLIVFTTEGFAVWAREGGRSNTGQVAPQIRDDGQIDAGGDLTPTLIWTAPLSILLTMAGAGAAGFNTLRDGASSARGRVAQAELEASDARRRMLDEQAAARNMRAEAAKRIERAGNARAAAGAEIARVETMVKLFEAEEARHDALRDRFQARARVEYRVAAKRLEQDELEGRVASRVRSSFDSGVLVLGGALSILVGAVTILLGAAMATATVVGAATLLAVGLSWRILDSRRPALAREAST